MYGGVYCPALFTEITGAGNTEDDRLDEHDLHDGQVSEPGCERSRHLSDEGWCGVWFASPAAVLR